MNEIFKKDIIVRVISVFAAIILWIYVYNVDVNPYTTQTVSVPVKSINGSALVDKDIKLDSKLPDSIDIKVNGRKNSLDKLKDTDIKATIDFDRIKSVDDKSLSVDIQCSKEGVDVQNLNTGYYVDISLSRIKDDTFPIEIVPNITFKPGYKKLKISIVPDSIKLQGEEAIMDSVDVVRATLDIKDLDRDITKRVEWKVYNKEGKNISKYFTTNTVDVKIEVAKEVPVNLVVTGKLAPDYVEVLRRVNPQTVLITGVPEVLAKVGELKTEPVSIENLKQSLDITGAIKLPDGVKLADTGKDIAVSITVEKLEVKDYTVLKDNIAVLTNNFDSTLKYDVKTESVSTALKGRIEHLSLLRVEDLNPSVDLQGLTEGTHKLLLKLNLPDTVKQLQPVYVEVVVKKAETPAETTKEAQ